MVQEPNRCKDLDRRVPAAVQRGPTPLKPRAAHAARVQTEAINNEIELSFRCHGNREAGQPINPINQHPPTLTNKSHPRARPTPTVHRIGTRNRNLRISSDPRLPLPRTVMEIEGQTEKQEPRKEEGEERRTKHLANAPTAHRALTRSRSPNQTPHSLLRPSGHARFRYKVT